MIQRRARARQGEVGSGSYNAGGNPTPTKGLRIHARKVHARPGALRSPCLASLLLASSRYTLAMIMPVPLECCSWPSIPNIPETTIECRGCGKQLHKGTSTDKGHQEHTQLSSAGDTPSRVTGCRSDCELQSLCVGVTVRGSHCELQCLCVAVTVSCSACVSQ